MGNFFSSANSFIFLRRFKLMLTCITRIVRRDSIKQHCEKAITAYKEYGRVWGALVASCCAECLTCQASGANDVADALTFTVRDKMSRSGSNAVKQFTRSFRPQATLACGSRGREGPLNLRSGLRSFYAVNQHISNASSHLQTQAALMLPYVTDGLAR